MIKKAIFLNLLMSSALYAHPIEDDSKEEIKSFEKIASFYLSHVWER